MDKWKMLLTFTLLVLTLGWAAFLVLAKCGVIGVCLEDVEQIGVGVVIGAFISWTGNSLQYWFRKKVEG